VEAQHHLVPDRDALDPFTDLLDHPGPLVTENDRASRTHAPSDLEIGVADPRRDETHEDLVLPGCLQLDLLDQDREIRTA
jgi:hypothetical protein